MVDRRVEAMNRVNPSSEDMLSATRKNLNSLTLGLALDLARLESATSHVWLAPGLGLTSVSSPAEPELISIFKKIANIVY